MVFLDDVGIKYTNIVGVIFVDIGLKTNFSQSLIMVFNKGVVEYIPG